MIIGIDASRANRKHRTGTEWYAYHLIREFALQDKKNEYILYTDNPLRGGLLDLTKNDESEIENKIKYDNEGYQVLKSPHNNFKAKILKWPFKYFWTLGGLSLEMVFNKPDALFVPSHALPLVRPKKTLITIHDIGFLKDSSLFGIDEIGPDVFSFKKIISFFVRIFTLGKYGANSLDYLKWSTKYALKKASNVITVSEFSKKEIETFYKVKKGKLTVVHNGYDKKLYKKINNEEKLKFVLDNLGIEQPYIFYIGRLEKKKNTSALIEAYAIMRDRKINNHKLLLVGDASYGYDEAKYMTREFDLVDDIIMPGWLDEDIVPYLYNGASLFILPSKYEGFGIPLLQAMACGTPIIAANTSSIPEVAKDAAHYFNPDYSLSIADSMCEVLNKPELREKLIKNGYERVKEFGWGRTAKKTLDILLEK